MTESEKARHSTNQRLRRMAYAAIALVGIIAAANETVTRIGKHNPVVRVTTR